jgi:SAM-dependent methyltransferase
MDALFWRDRYREQVGWSGDTRRAVFDHIRAKAGARLLEVGSGYGALLGALHAEGFTRGMGLDIDLASLLASESASPQVCADGLRLPARENCVDICLSHFFLLWVADPLAALREMARVTVPGGWVIALAEPDYGARLDHPPPLAALGRRQSRALASQGADIRMGRQLGGLFHQAGLGNITCGIQPARWQAARDADGSESEWRVLEKDLAGIATHEEMEAFRRQDEDARQDGTRVLYVPTFYACGQVSEAPRPG